MNSQIEDEQLAPKIKVRPQSGRPLKSKVQVVPAPQQLINTKILAKYDSQANSLCVVPAPAITSKSWIIYDLKEDRVF